MKLNVKAFGIASGILTAIWVAWIVVIAMMGKGVVAFEMLNQIYLGLLAPTAKGLVIGVVIAFVDGTVGAMIFAWIYNKLAGSASA